MYNQLFKVQDGKCWICHDPPSPEYFWIEGRLQGEIKLKLDKHGDKIRGLVCSTCKRRIGGGFNPGPGPYRTSSPMVI